MIAVFCSIGTHRGSAASHRTFLFIAAMFRFGALSEKNCNPHDDPLWYTNREGLHGKTSLGDSDRIRDVCYACGCQMRHLKMIVTESKDCRRD